MSPVSPTASASDMQMDYMKLLITQMQNQNPLEPMNNDQMASQLAQFSQLQQLESLNSNSASLNTSFADALVAANRSYATSLIDREVTFFFDDPDSDVIIKKVGTVTEAFYDSSTGESLIGVSVPGEDGKEIAEEYTLGLEAVKLVK